MPLISTSLKSQNGVLSDASDLKFKNNWTERLITLVSRLTFHPKF